MKALSELVQLRSFFHQLLPLINAWMFYHMAVYEFKKNKWFIAIYADICALSAWNLARTGVVMCGKMSKYVTFKQY